MGEVKMTVNVSLCGSVPRSQMICGGIQSKKKTRATDPRLPFFPNENTLGSGCQSSLNTSSPIRKHRRVSIDNTVPQPTQIAPPPWAVPARGEARLEPVRVGLYSHSPVDLNAKACIRFGRSPSSDVQLLHDTSSRRHALIFHHPNGSCYVIDCGSAHGTYVNGNRVNTPVISTRVDQDSSRTGAVIPHRVKKGSLIRFGGAGAPSYILKSFSVSLSTLVKDLEIAEVFTCTSNFIEDERITLSQNTRGRYNQNENISSNSLLTVNTRLNAMGSASTQMASSGCLPVLARARLGTQCTSDRFTAPFLKKRSLSSLIPRCVSDDDQIPKKRRTTLFADSHNLPLSPGVTDVALISPSRSKQSFTIDLGDTDRPVVSPNPSNDHDNLELDCGVKTILMVPLTLSLSRKAKKRVKFSANPPETFIIPTHPSEESFDFNLRHITG